MRSNCQVYYLPSITKSKDNRDSFMHISLKANVSLNHLVLLLFSVYQSIDGLQSGSDVAAVSQRKKIYYSTLELHVYVKTEANRLC